MTNILVFEETEEETRLKINGVQKLISRTRNKDRKAELFRDYLLTEHLQLIKLNNVDLFKQERTLTELLNLVDSIGFKTELTTIYPYFTLCVHHE